MFSRHFFQFSPLLAIKRQT